MSKLRNLRFSLLGHVVSIAIRPEDVIDRIDRLAHSNMVKPCTHPRKCPVGIAQIGNGVVYTYKCLGCNEALGTQSYVA